ncbi:hypothetical protein GCM10027053_31150 [Intrasporangium mesophilum]
MSDAVSSPSLAFQILGPLRVWRDGCELDPRPRQQAYLLAMLLLRSGRPVSTSELIDLVWDEDMPTSALNIVHKYVGTLRRILEPDLPARAAGSYLHRRGSGYQFTVGDAALDLAEFRALLADARVLMSGHRIDEAVTAYEAALGTWRGPAGDGLVLSTAAVPLVASVNEELLDACVEAAHAAVPHGHAKRILQPLRLAAWIAPYDETVQATLITTLAAAGHQAEALSVFESVRTRLVEELGIDPGPVLREAQAHVLQQAGPAPLITPVRQPVPGIHDGLVGRREELALVRHALDSAAFSRPQILVVDGPPGVGKSRLIAQVTEEAATRGAQTVWGRCQDGEGTPSMWPWVQIIETLLGLLPEGRRASWRTPELDALLELPAGRDTSPVQLDAGARFRLYERVTALVAEAANRPPLVIVVDDLHWADSASLQLFGHLAQSVPAGCVLIGSMRSHAPSPSQALQHLLAVVARQEHHRRVVLGPLEPSDVAELVRRETGQTPAPDVARSIQARTEGNPLFVRELARFLGDEGALSDPTAALAAVPSTVRDIVLDRTRRLDNDDRCLIELAALMGREIDVRLLASAAAVDATHCLTSLEALDSAGLVEPPSDPAGPWRFVHDLVREAVERSVLRTEASLMHLRIADALQDSAPVPADRFAEALAHHLCGAGPLAEPARVAQALVAAGRIAARRSAYDTAERDLTSAAEIAGRAGLPELELAALTELTAVAGIHAGFVGSATGHLDRGAEVARSLGRDREAAGFVFSRFLGHAQGIQVEAAGQLARRMLDDGLRSTDPVVQATGHHAWGVYQWSAGNIGEAYRNLSRSDEIMQAAPESEPLRHRLQMVTPVMLALNTALHGDLDGSRALFDAVEVDAHDNPYAISIWGSFSVTAAAAAGDPAWAARAADTAIAVDPEFSFSFSGSYPRLARQWALAMSGDDAGAAAAEAERIIAATLVDPPRSNLAIWYALLAEMQLAAGDPRAATSSLDKAETFIAAYGERYAEALVLLIRAKTLHGLGAAEPEVLAAARRASDLARNREAHLFAARAADFLEEIS